MIGVDKVPVTPMPQLDGVAKPVLTTLQTRVRRSRRALAARGFTEAVTWSFVPHEWANAFGGGDRSVQLANPISPELSDMRPSLLAGLAMSAQKNADRGHGDLALFEVGQVFAGARTEDQTTSAAGLRRGTAGPHGAGRHWSGPAQAVGVFDVKADALAVLDALGVNAANVQVVNGAPAWFHPGRSGTIRQGPKKIIATFGELHPAVMEALGLEGPLAGFEVTLEAIPEPRAKATRTRPAIALSPFQPVSRDFAFVVEDSVASEKIVRAARSADRKLIAGVDVFDVFAGASLGEGRKSVAIDVRLQPTEATLTDEEIEAVSSRIVAAVEKATGGTLRA